MANTSIGLTAIKNVAGKFVTGGENLDGRFSDLVGLITFAGYADGETPPTLDHAFLVSQLNNAQIVTNRSEDGTAIGDAISLAVEKLNALDQRQKQKVKSKVIILLTDGENNAGELEPIQAAELAQTMGIKVYTIGVGTKGQAPVPVTDAFRTQNDPVDAGQHRRSDVGKGCSIDRRQILPSDRHRFAGKDLRRD